MKFDKLFAIAKEKGLEDFQISYSSSDSTDINAYESKLQAFTISRTEKLVAKGIYQGKMGSVYTESFEPQSFEAIVDQVIENAKAVTSKDQVFIYPGDSKYGHVFKPYRKELELIPMEKKIALAVDAAKKLMSKEFVTYAESEYSEGSTSYILMNSKGLKLKFKANEASLVVSCIVKKDDDTRDDYESHTSNDFSEFKPDELIEKAYQEAIMQIGAKPVASGNYEIVFGENAVSTFMGSFSDMFSADNVQKNMSILKGKIGEKIASSKVTVVDDPLLKGSSSSIPFDSEGVATSYKEIVKNGVLQGFLYNLKTANKDHVKSTGNASGSRVEPINLHLKTGRRSKDDMIKDIKYGLYIDELAGSSTGTNPISGDFSLQSAGYVIRDGKRAEPVALITVSDNFLELLSKVKEVSNKLENGCESPAIRVKNIAVAGAK